MQSSPVLTNSSSVKSDLPEFTEALQPIRERFRSSRHGRTARRFNELEPAFHLGYVARRRFTRFAFDEIEPHLAAEWAATRRSSPLEWSDVRQAALDAWLYCDGLERAARLRSYSADC